MCLLLEYTVVTERGGCRTSLGYKPKLPDKSQKFPNPTVTMVTAFGAKPLLQANTHFPLHL